ncbi:hypothetical protein GCM10027592_57030 [Spirosoma flavus]
MAIDLELMAVLKDILADWADPNNQFLITANYYDQLTQGREGERWYIAHIWISQESAHNITLTDEGLVCDVHLNRHDFSLVSRILLPFDQIWNVQRVTGSLEPTPSLYYRVDKMNLRRPGDDD